MTAVSQHQAALLASAEAVALEGARLVARHLKVTGGVHLVGAAVGGVIAHALLHTTVLQLKKLCRIIVREGVQFNVGKLLAKAIETSFFIFHRFDASAVGVCFANIGIIAKL